MVPDFVYFTNVVELWGEGFFFWVKMSKPMDKGNTIQGLRFF
jgi:hypothetical protein